jgi:hypothetical protein
MANQCGGSGPTALLGRSRVLAPDGGVVAEAVRVGPHAGAPTDQFLLVDIDVRSGIEEWERTSAALWTDAPGESRLPVGDAGR